VTLLDAIEEHGFDAAIGGARRDEERARAKERIFSHRDEFGQWDPKNQRPELWNALQRSRAPGEHFRVFPSRTGPSSTCGSTSSRRASSCPRSTSRTSARCSSATGCYYAHEVHRALLPSESVTTMEVRFRTVGDMTCTGAVTLAAAHLDEVIAEVAASR
jgi:sulfate adenylyltransferase subunit 2